MKARKVIGSNLGDEGKGTVVAYYTKNAKGPVLNVLTNGGSQRAHSILTENGNFTFQHFGAGTYYGADNFYSKFFILNPIQFSKEYKELCNRNININKIYRDKDCIWSTPWDMITNQIIESNRKKDNHGSCGMGIWETVLRYKTTFNISFDDFISLEDKKSYLIKIRKYFELRLNNDIPESWKSIWYSNILIENFIDDCIFLYNNTSTILTDISKYDEIIFENGQGLLLNDTGYDIPGTTPSFTDSRDSEELIKQFNIEDVTSHYVTRPYMTRHGKGELKYETPYKNISSDIKEDRTNHYNKFQEYFRYGKLDIDKLRERIDNDNLKYNRNIVLEITHCDEMDRISEFKKKFNEINIYDSPII